MRHAVGSRDRDTQYLGILQSAIVSIVEALQAGPVRASINHRESFSSTPVLRRAILKRKYIASR